MIIKVLFGQRVESYEGEYAPEALAVADGRTDDVAPEFLQDMKKENEESGQFIGVKVIEFEVDGLKIRNLLVPQNPKIDAVMKS